MPSIRKAAVAGQFYPDNPLQLKAMVAQLLVEATPTKSTVQPKALIVPHAGYIYSGSTAAKAFSSLLDFGERITRVVLLGPSHRVGFNGLAVSNADYYQTPLGDIGINQESIQLALTLPQVSLIDEAHELEHSLEVELPFLQETLDDFTLVPLVVGEADSQSVSEVLELLWGDDRTLIVISSDLSHFLDYNTAQKKDKKTCESIENLSPNSIDYDDACGKNPIKGLLISAKNHELSVTTLALCNSGDTAGDKNRVVGYGSWILTKYQ